MRRLVNVDVEGSGILWIEVDVADETVDVPAARTRGPSLPLASLDRLVDTAKSISNSVINRFRKLEVAPDSIEVSFGLKASSRLGAILAAGEAEANINFKLTWEKGARHGTTR